MGKLTFEPGPGVLTCIPYVSSSAVFKPAKTSAGDVQLSKVLLVGKEYTDDNGNLRQSPCKEGDIIVHEYTPHSGDIDFQEYRFVKFYQFLSKITEK